MKKTIMIAGAGAGVGAILPILTKKYSPNSAVYLPIAAGAIGVGIGLFTKLIQKSTTNDFVTMFGFASLFGGIMNYITVNGFRLPSLRQNNPQRYPYAASRGNGIYMSTGNPYQVTSRVPAQQNITRQPGQGTGRILHGLVITS